MAIGSILYKLKDWGHLMAPVGIILVVFLILVPLPPDVLDIFFTFNIIMN